MEKINKEVIPLAGLGTRMLPATKVIPKEMHPILNKSIIQFIVEEEILSKSSSPLDFHSNILTPFKGETEIWFNKRNSIVNYFINIFLTVWIVLLSKSKILEKVFLKRPRMPQELKDIMELIKKND